MKTRSNPESKQESVNPKSQLTLSPTLSPTWSNSSRYFDKGPDKVNDKVENKVSDKVLKCGHALPICIALSLLTTACISPRATKGGKAVTTPKPNGTLSQTLVQGEDASQISKQDQDIVRVRTYTLPPGSRIEESRLQTTAGGVPVTNVQSILVGAPMAVIEREETHARTELGAAQKNTARELSAKLASLKGVVWVGLGLFIFGVASLVWPPLKLIIGSVTTSAALALGGVALIILPSLVVGNELLIFAGVALAIGVWSMAHRHGQLRGLVAAAGGAGSVERAAVGASNVPGPNVCPRSTLKRSTLPRKPSK